MVTVVAYARVSTDRQAEKQTIAQQVERLQTYAQQYQWQLATDQIYKDDGFSGARLDRPALDRLRDAAANGAIDVVLITSLTGSPGGTPIRSGSWRSWSVPVCK